MKRLLLCIVILAALLLLCAGAPAEDGSSGLPGGNTMGFNSWNFRNSTVYYLGLDDDLQTVENDELQQDSFVTQYMYGSVIDDSQPTGTAVFTYSVEGNAVFDIQPYTEGIKPLINVYLTEMPASPETDIIHLACEWDGYIWEQDYTVDFLDAPADLPSGVSLSYEEPLTFVAGTEFCPKEMIDFAGGWRSQGDDFFNVELTYINAYGFAQDWEFVRWDSELGKHYYTLTRYGEYTCVLTVQSARVVWKHEFTVRVTDESGEIPATQLTFDGNYITIDGMPTYGYYYAPGLTSETNENGVRVNTNAMKLSIDYNLYQELSTSIGGTPAWRVERLEGDYTPAIAGLGSTANLMFITQPESDSVCLVNVICEWGEMSASRQITINVTECPGGLPEGIVLDFGDTWTVKAGEYQTGGIISHASFINDWSIPDENRSSGYFLGGASYSMPPTGEIRFTTPGVYTGAYIELGYANITCRREFTLVVTDENGNIPEPALHVATENTDTWHYYLNDLTENPDEQGRYSRDSRIAQFYINSEDYNTIRPTTDDLPEWSLEIVSGDLDLRLDTDMLYGQYSNLAVGEKPVQPGTTEFLLRCEWGGRSFEKQLAVVVMECPGGMPEGIELDFGDTFTTMARVTVVPYNFSQHASFTNGWSIEGEELQSSVSFGSASTQSAPNGFVFTTPGNYSGFIELSYANIVCRRNFLLTVTDENGNVPELGLHVDIDKDTYYYYLSDLSTEPDEKGRYSMSSMTLLFGINYDDYERIRQTTAEKPAWSIEILSGSLNVSVREDDRFCLLTYGATSREPDTTEFLLCCDWAGFHYEKQLSVAAVELPNGLPEGLELDFGDTWTVEAGKNYSDESVRSHFSMIDNWSIEGEPQSYGYSYGGAPTNGFLPMYICFTTPGVYENAFMEIIYANIVCRKYYTLNVVEESAAELHVDTGASDTYCFYLNDLTEFPDEKGRYSRDVMIQQFIIADTDYREISQTTDEDPQWSIGIVSGSLDVQIDPRTVLGSTQYCNLIFGTKPTQPDTTVFNVRCEWAGRIFEKQLTVKAMELPDGLPEGIEFDFGDTWTVRAGETIPLDFSTYAHFINGWSIDGVQMYSMTDFGTNVTWTPNGFVCETPGVYNGSVTLRYANITCRRYFTLIVTDENGVLPVDAYSGTPGEALVLPKGLVSIEESAFENVPARVVVLPDGCGTIGSGAFRNCVNLKEISIPASVTEIADDAFEGCGTVFCLTDSELVKTYCLNHGLVPVMAVTSVVGR